MLTSLESFLKVFPISHVQQEARVTLHVVYQYQLQGIGHGDSKLQMSSTRIKILIHTHC